MLCSLIERKEVNFKPNTYIWFQRENKNNFQFNFFQLQIKNKEKCG